MKKIIAAVIAIVIVILIVIIGMTPQESIFNEPVYETNDGTKQIVRDIINDESDGRVEIDENMIYEEKCEICEDDECIIEEFECWKVNVTENNVTSEVVVSKSSGGGASGGSVITKSPPIPPECTYFYEENTDQLYIENFNNNCDNPLPKCDQTREECVVCTNNAECIQTQIITEKSTSIKIYKYHIIGTLFNGYYFETNSSCIIDDSTIIIYQKTPMEFEECRNEIFSHATCGESAECFFI